jgi:putative ABC transport system ATP-binding protein
MIELIDVSVVHAGVAEQVEALRGVSMQVDAGELVVVMGPSASGKSTLIDVCAGVRLPSSGVVRIGGVDMAKLRPRQRARMRRTVVGVMFQDHELDPVLTAAQNVALPLRLDRVGPASAELAARTALDRCGVAAVGERRPDELSGGQRQRVALARAIVGERQVVLADEPTAALDTASARAVTELLASLAHEGRAVLMTSHDGRLASIADRVAFLRDGRIVDGQHREAAS